MVPRAALANDAKRFAVPTVSHLRRLGLFRNAFPALPRWANLLRASGAWVFPSPRFSHFAGLCSGWKARPTNTLGSSQSRNSARGWKPPYDKRLFEGLKAHASTVCRVARAATRRYPSGLVLSTFQVARGSIPKQENFSRKQSSVRRGSIRPT